MFNGADQRGGGRGVVDYQGQAVLVRNGSECLDIGDVVLGVAETLGVDGAGFGVDGLAKAVEIVGIDEADVDAEPRQRVVEEIVGAAVKGGSGDDLLSGGGGGGDGESLG